MAKFMPPKCGFSALPKVRGGSAVRGTSPWTELRRSFVSADQADAKRIERELHAVADRELVKDVVHVGLHGALANVEPLGDFAVTQAERHAANDLSLASGERPLAIVGERRAERGLQSRW